MKVNPEFVAREIAGELVLVPVGGAAVSCDGLITCNELGAFIWRGLENGMDMPQLLAAVLSEYETDEGTAKADIEEFVADLARLGAVTE